MFHLSLKIFKYLIIQKGTHFWPPIFQTKPSNVYLSKYSNVLCSSPKDSMFCDLLLHIHVLGPLQTFNYLIIQRKTYLWPPMFQTKPSNAYLSKYSNVLCSSPKIPMFWDILLHIHVLGRFQTFKYFIIHRRTYLWPPIFQTNSSNAYLSKYSNVLGSSANICLFHYWILAYFKYNKYNMATNVSNYFN